MRVVLHQEVLSETQIGRQRVGGEEKGVLPQKKTNLISRNLFLWQYSFKVFCVVCRSTRCDLIQRFCYCPFITPKYYRGHWLGKYLSTEKLPLARRRRKNKNEISCGRKTSTAWIFFVCSTPHVGSRPLAWIIQTKHVYLQMPKVPHVCTNKGGEGKPSTTRLWAVHMRFATWLFWRNLPQGQKEVRRQFHVY